MDNGIPLFLVKYIFLSLILSSIIVSTVFSREIFDSSNSLTLKGPADLP
ncbi:MAG: hypothetical protein QXJ36_02390 [Desulfurococcaceae archaeon]